MKLKVQNVQFDARYPIMVTLTKTDKEAIKNMPEDANRLASFPASGGWSLDAMNTWMDKPGILQENFTGGI